jgi:4-hydroxymandelate oxidase
MAKQRLRADRVVEPGNSGLLNLFDYEAKARTTMDPVAYELVASGGADEITVRWNREAFDKIALVPRVLVDVSKLDTRVDLFGQAMPFPILVAPTAVHRLYNSEGEIATAKGAGAAGATFVISTYTTTPIEDIAAAATGPLWFQLYVQEDKGATKDLVQRAEAAGCQALCVTVDTPTFGVRNRQDRAGFSYQSLPAGVSTTYVSSSFAPISITWKDIDWLSSFCRVPILLKGVLDPDDADEAVKRGASGVIVSNHGGRELDTVPASIDALSPIVDKIAGRIPILMDGGVRRGTDVLKAIASGATAVLIGRPVCYGLGVAGAEGVDRVISILRTEFETAMALSGRPTIESIDRTVIWPERA